MEISGVPILILLVGGIVSEYSIFLAFCETKLSLENNAHNVSDYSKKIFMNWVHEKIPE